MLDDLHCNHPPRRNDIPIADALRALPLQSPPHSAWPALATALAKRERRPRHWPFALAASLALAAVLGSQLRTAPETANTPVASTADPLRQILVQSAQLEALIANSSDIGTSAPMMSLSADLEDQLAVIDSQLGNIDLNPAERLPLWQQRVQVLRELAGLQATQQWLATRGEQNTVDALVYAY
jgi:hypothetical protein